jgi:hypothetical protein
MDLSDEMQLQISDMVRHFVPPPMLVDAPKVPPVLAIEDKQDEDTAVNKNRRRARRIMSTEVGGIRRRDLKGFAPSADPLLDPGAGRPYLGLPGPTFDIYIYMYIWSLRCLTLRPLRRSI